MNILVVDDQQETCDFLQGLLTERQHVVACCPDAESALAQIRGDGRPDLVILDLDFGPGRLNGLAALEQIQVLSEPPTVVILSGKGTIDAAVRAMRLGAVDFVEKDVYIGERIAAAVARVAERQALESERRALLKERDYFRERERVRHDIVGEAPALRQALRLAEQVAPLPRPVLIRGERGTGKELFAAAVHRASTRAQGPFVVVNCAAIAEGLLECELFGQEENAFDGAPFKLGRFEIADQGTLFLDEIGNMSLDFQSKILRVIEYQDFEHVQGTERISVDVRIIAATNCDLEAAMEAGRFRRDLYDRIAFQTVWLPPLRERKDDIPPLCRHFIARFVEEVPGVEPAAVSAEALARLQAYDWPGNVRELKNVIEAALWRASRGAIRADDVALPAPPREQSREPQNLPDQVAEFEKTLLLEALDAASWNQKQAAAALGLKYDQMRHLFRKYDLAALRP